MTRTMLCPSHAMPLYHATQACATGCPVVTLGMVCPGDEPERYPSAPQLWLCHGLLRAAPPFFSLFFCSFFLFPFSVSLLSAVRALSSQPMAAVRLASHHIV
eukprot:840830-Rhodomonas_salina.1